MQASTKMDVMPLKQYHLMWNWRNLELKKTQNLVKVASIQRYIRTYLKYNHVLLNATSLIVPALE